jgi:hypothetical protein
MKITPAMKAGRIAKLDFGDLFLLIESKQPCVALAVTDGDESSEKLAILLGPTFPLGLTGPFLVPLRSATAISFGKDFVVRLPVQADAWSETMPPEDSHPLLVADEGVYVRANFGHSGVFAACYADLATGRICVAGSGGGRRYVPPPGIGAFAVRWEIVTSEPQPRTILSYPS